MQMPIPDDWDGQSFCSWAVCWPDSIKWKAILYGLIEQPSQGRYWDANTGNINATRLLFKPAYDKNFTLARCLMACDDEGMLAIAAAINNLANAQREAATIHQGCCDGGSAGQGESAPPYDDTVIEDPGEGPPPEGFESWEQYFANKCAVATDIVNTLIADINRMTTINLVGLTLVSLIPILISLLLTPIPGDEIAVIGGILLAVLALGSAMLDNIGDVLSDNSAELICELYNGTSASDAESRFETKFNDLWDAAGLGSAPYAFSAKMAIQTMIGPASTNKLFNLQSDRILPEGDCSECGPCEPDMLLYSGTGEFAFDGGMYEFVGEFDGTHTYVQLLQCNEYCNPPSASPCCNFRIIVEAVSHNDVRWEVTTNCENVEQVAPQSIVTVGQNFVMKSMRFYRVGNNPFDITVTLDMP